LNLHDIVVVVVVEMILQQQHNMSMMMGDDVSNYWFGRQGTSVHGEGVGLIVSKSWSLFPQ